MDSNYVDKSRLPSRHVTEGPERASHRSDGYAMILTGKAVAENLEFAPDGAIVKVAGLKNLRFAGPARVFVREKRTYEEGDVVTGGIAANVTDEEFLRRKAARKPRETEYGSGAIWKYSPLVGPARFGALTNPGAQGEKECYADI